MFSPRRVRGWNLSQFVNFAQYTHQAIPLSVFFIYEGGVKVKVNASLLRGDDRLANSWKVPLTELDKSRGWDKMLSKVLDWASQF